MARSVMKARQSLATLEEEFRQGIAEERARDRALQRHVVVRSRQRTIERRKKLGTMRFWLLVLGLIATAIGVTVAMFETLYWLLG
ncbi:MAG: hypothetical protein ACJ764_08775 [Solirubrobacteraceae bacterium]